MKEGQQGAAGIKRADFLQMYYYLRLTRTLEDRITALYRQGRIVGGVYTSNGMEAISVAYASVLERDDIIAPFHRDMGAFLVRGITPGEVIAQYLGKRGGPTKGNVCPVAGDCAGSDTMPLEGSHVRQH